MRNGVKLPGIRSQFLNATNNLKQFVPSSFLKLELLAPARNKDIGIAAIDCGADSVYLAGPAFGEREAASNEVGDIAAVAAYAHRFGAKVFVTLNTILYESELEEARKLVYELYEAGADALIVQDLSLLKMDLPPIELHASTQCAIRTPAQARMLESLGFRRLVLERQLTLRQIEAIRKAVSCELECFVHGALCVSYSGNCYLSQYLTGRSANRGACAQACRALYDLVAEDGRVLVKNRSLLSLKDLKLDSRVSSLAAAGICSFKIEGRLKSASYVKNVVSHYRKVFDELIAANPELYARASYGTPEGGFEPALDATFNRGYTPLLMGSIRGAKWNSGDAARSMGKLIGRVAAVESRSVIVDTEEHLSNGDGLAFISSSGKITGCRADVVSGARVTMKSTSGISVGDAVYRNFSINFEKELEKNMPRRMIPARIIFSSGCATASVEGLGEVAVALDPSLFDRARDPQKAVENITRQLSKSAGCYSFTVIEVDERDLRFYPAAYLSSLRRTLAEELEKKMCEMMAEERESRLSAPVPQRFVNEEGNKDYLLNCSNSLSGDIYEELGFGAVAPAYELKPVADAELMRSRYCIRRELGMCLKEKGSYPGALSLVNNGKKLSLRFDCEKCEMVVTL